MKISQDFLCPAQTCEPKRLHEQPFSQVTASAKHYLWADSLTADATACATSRLNADGTMYSRWISVSVTMFAIACAAASFISSVIFVAPESRRPRKKPGKQR